MAGKKTAKSTSSQPPKRVRLDSSYDSSNLSDSSSDISAPMVGTIKSVTLKNFMCHDNLKFDFTRNVNFIIGRNGSGKSAVLTGIILALGGKSSITGRFTSLAGFIKHGRTVAYILVTLSNEGDTPYKPEEYGSEIIIERMISTNGSGYKIKTRDGAVKHTSKEDLDKILDYLKIQIDNPVSVLTQETSRCFLDSKNPKDKYKCFFKATQLERLNENYSISGKNALDSEIQLQRRKEALPQMENEIKKWEMNLEMASKITEYENELLWSCVIELEKEKDAKRLEYNIAQKHLKAAQDKLEETKRRCDTNAEALEQTKKKLNECKTDRNLIKNELDELKLKMEPLKTETLTLKGKKNKAERESQKNKEEIQSLLKNIQEAREKSMKNVMEEKRHKEEKINKLKQTILALKQEEESISHERSKLVDDVYQKERTLQQLKFEVEEAKKNKISIWTEISTLEKSVKDPVHIFGHYMQELLNTIEEASKKNYFRKKPIGPIARFVNVKTREWLPTIAIVLGEIFLRSFCCDNFEDSDKLNRMIDQCQRGSQRQKQKHQVIVSTFEPHVYNLSGHKAVSKYPTVLDMIECTDTVVANCLIDQRSIESILLIDFSKDAMNLMMHNPPKNCNSCYLPSGDQIYPAPKYRYYSCKTRAATYLLQSVNQDDIRQRKEQYQMLHQNEEIKNRQLATENQQLMNLQKKIGSIKSNLENILYRIDICAQEIVELQEVEETRDLNCLQDDLESQYAEKERLERQKIELEEELGAKFELYKEYKEKHDLKVDIYKDASTNSITLENQVVEFEQWKENYTKEKQDCEKSVGVENTKMAAVEREYKEAEAKAKSSAEEAVKVCHRVQTKRLPRSIEINIIETKKIVEQESKCNKKDLKAKFEEKKKEFHKAKESVENSTREVGRLKRMLEIRKKKFVRIRQTTGNIVHYDFINCLKTNKYSGSMDVCYEKGTLTIHARPCLGSSESSNSTKELSGGERSFVTISFLLALWSCIEMPFRILDEYDVFMDAVNRQLSLSLMIDKALKDSSRQFIFLSPLELPIMEQSDQVKVHKMPAPKRSA